MPIGSSSSMGVCNRIDDYLWQTGIQHWPEHPPQVDIVITACENTPIISYVPMIVVPFKDFDHIMLDDGLFSALCGLAEGVKDLCVLTVCSEGRNRSGLFSALILIKRGMKVQEAIETVKRRARYPGSNEALTNQMFIAALRSLEDA